ncbi:hypothetical protein FVP45_11930, partial [Mycobacterium tuberculosis]|nr:hypothetical protein [Mycobacterium tuberculosis]
ASSPMPGEFAAHSDQPAIPSQSPLSAPTSQRPVSREKSLPSGNYNQWDLVPMIRPSSGTAPGGKPAPKPQHAVFFTNMGML